jgi:lysyl-tRNA synthetase class 2
MMDITEELVRNAAREVAGGLQVQYQGQALDFGPPFRRASMHELVKAVTGAAFLPISALFCWASL